jgi:SAM-dependent methyltransferase
MAHREQREYCEDVVNRYKDLFVGKKVLDCGSLDINGSNRHMFTDCEHIGIDLGLGKNVDVVSTIHEYPGEDGEFDVIVSTECFEHDMHYKKSLKNIVRMLKSGGIFVFTCATDGRAEHGTLRVKPQDAPFLEEDWRNYYKNLNEGHIRTVIDIEDTFSQFKFSVHTGHKDLQFWGIKKNEN